VKFNGRVIPREASTNDFCVAKMNIVVAVAYLPNSPLNAI